MESIIAKCNSCNKEIIEGEEVAIGMEFNSFYKLGIKWPIKIEITLCQKCSLDKGHFLTDEHSIGFKLESL